MSPYFYPRALSFQEIAILRQIEYYFGYPNYLQDLHLQTIRDQNGWVSVSEVLKFRQMRRIGVLDGKKVAQLVHECSPVVTVDLMSLKICPSWMPKPLMLSPFCCVPRNFVQHPDGQLYQYMHPIFLAPICLTSHPNPVWNGCFPQAHVPYSNPVNNAKPSHAPPYGNVVQEECSPPGVSYKNKSGSDQGKGAEDKNISKFPECRGPPAVTVQKSTDNHISHQRLPVPYASARSPIGTSAVVQEGSGINEMPSGKIGEPQGRTMEENGLSIIDKVSSPVSPTSKSSLMTETRTEISHIIGLARAGTEQSKYLPSRVVDNKLAHPDEEIPNTNKEETKQSLLKADKLESAYIQRMSYKGAFLGLGKVEGNMGRASSNGSRNVVRIKSPKCKTLRTVISCSSMDNDQYMGSSSSVLALKPSKLPRVDGDVLMRSEDCTEHMTRADRSPTLNSNMSYLDALRCQQVRGCNPIRTSRSSIGSITAKKPMGENNIANPSIRAPSSRVPDIDWHDDSPSAVKSFGPLHSYMDMLLSKKEETRKRPSVHHARDPNSKIFNTARQEEVRKSMPAATKTLHSNVRIFQNLRRDPTCPHFSPQLSTIREKINQEWQEVTNVRKISDGDFKGPRKKGKGTRSNYSRPRRSRYKKS